MTEVEWRAWVYPTDAAAKAAFDAMQTALVARDDTDGMHSGVWRSRDPRTGARYVIALASPGAIHHAVLEEAVDSADATGAMPQEVSVRSRYAGNPLGGVFIHRDGTDHPFPEPRGGDS